MNAHEISLNLPSARAEYQEQSFAHLRSLISAADAAALYATTEKVAIERICGGGQNVSFGQQDVADEHPISGLFARDELTRLALHLTGSQTLLEIRCWTLVYRTGECIDAHTDGAGSVQALVCLTAPPAHSNGAYLLLRPNTPEQVTLALGPGDAVVFNATSVRHCTTPLTATAERQHPVRVVAVGRYFTT